MATNEAVTKKNKYFEWKFSRICLCDICHACLPECIFILINILCGNMDYLVFAVAVNCKVNFEDEIFTRVHSM